jgi:hypothetical protein
MLEANPSSLKTKLSAGQKLMIAGLICLQIPSGAVFFPLATIIILTGVGGPLSMVFWVIGTMPFSLAMKYKAAWQSGEDTEGGQLSRVVTEDVSQKVPLTNVELT